jgi:signal transduction histidine kinase
MKRLINCFILLLISNALVAQVNKDSILTAISSSELTDTIEIFNGYKLSSDLIGVDLDFAEVLIDTVIYKCHKNGNISFLLSSQLRKADIYRYKMQHEECLTLIDSILANKKLQNYTSTKAWALSLKGNVLSDVGRKGEAIKTLYEAIKISEVEKDSSLTSYLYNSLGNNYIDQKEYKKAINNYFISLKYTNKDYPKSRGIAYFHIGSAHQRLENIDSAVYYYKLTEKEYSKIDYPSGMAGIANNIGKLHFKNKNYKEAIVQMEKALSYDKKVGSIYYIAGDYLNLAKFHKADKNLQKASYYVNLCIELSEKTKDKQTLYEGYEILSEINHTLKDNTLAYKYLSRSVEYKDSLGQAKNVRMVKEVEEKYQNEKKEAENQKLILEQQKNNQIIQLQKWLAIILAFVLFVVIIFLIIIYKERRGRIKTNIELFKTNKQLDIANKTKDKFFKIISHDLKSPFNAILGFANLLKSEYSSLDDNERIEMIGEIDKSSQLAYDLLNNLLTWAQTQTGGIKINKEPLSLKGLVETCSQLYGQSAIAKNIDIVVNIPTDIILTIDKNTSMIFIGNLINNAIKFTPEGGLISINASEEEEFVRLHIVDTGVGMPPEVLTNLFKIGENTSTQGTNNEKGTGLGLILCKEFIEKNGGEIEVNSKIGKGSDFIISIPKQIS